MKKTFFTFFAVAVTAANLFAQEPLEKANIKKTPEERADRMSQRMTQELILTKDQQAKVKTLILNYEKEREQTRIEEQQRREKMDLEMKSILTPEQYQKYLAAKKEMKGKHHGEHKHPADNK